MASPSVAGTNNSIQSSAVTSHTVNLPASIASGDLLIFFFVVVGTVDLSGSAPAGWTKLWSTNLFIGISWIVCWRDADGSEGSTVTQSTGSTSGKSAHASYRITGGSSADLSFGTYAAGNTSGPNPPSLTPAGGSNDYLWIALEGNNGPNNVTAYPTNYTLGQVTTNSGGTGGATTKCGIGVAARQFTGTNQDPAAFTIAATTDAGAQTFAVGPAAAAAATSDVIFPFARRPFMRTLLTR